MFVAVKILALAHKRFKRYLKLQIQQFLARSIMEKLKSSVSSDDSIMTWTG
jgi:hypothetical protein